jgi:hypothetical protein
MLLGLAAKGGDEGCENLGIGTGGDDGDQAFLDSKSGLSIVIQGVSSEQKLNKSKKVGVVKGWKER